jgi:hypothetical protein
VLISLRVDPLKLCSRPEGPQAGVESESELDPKVAFMDFHEALSIPS